MVKPRGIRQRHRERRDKMWPDADDVIWYRKSEVGFCTIPRTLSLAATLIKFLGDRLDASRVFIDFWTRNFDDGLVVIDDPEAMAVSCGYARGGRGVRTWRRALHLLEDLGFIRLKAKGTRTYGYVLLLHPNDAVERLHEEGKVPDWWWGLFTDLVLDTGTVLRLEKKREEEAEAKKAAVAGGLEDFPEALDEEDDDLPF